MRYTPPMGTPPAAWPGWMDEEHGSPLDTRLLIGGAAQSSPKAGGSDWAACELSVIVDFRASEASEGAQDPLAASLGVGTVMAKQGHPSCLCAVCRMCPAEGVQPPRAAAGSPMQGTQNPRQFQEQFESAGSTYEKMPSSCGGVFVSVRLGRADSVCEALDRGAPVDGRDGQMQTLLMVAAQHGNLHLVKLLLARGAHVGARNNGGWTAALLGLMQHRGPMILQQLLQAMADPSAVTPGGVTALHLACQSGDLTSVELLLPLIGREAIDYSTNYLHTALMMAVRARAVNVVQLLCQTGANVAAVGLGGNSVLGVACSIGHPQIVSMLLLHSAQGDQLLGHQNDLFQLPVHLAAIHGHAAVLQQLLLALRKQVKYGHHSLDYYYSRVTLTTTMHRSHSTRYFSVCGGASCDTESARYFSVRVILRVL